MGAAVGSKQKGIRVKTILLLFHERDTGESRLLGHELMVIADHLTPEGGRRAEEGVDFAFRTKWPASARQLGTLAARYNPAVILAPRNTRLPFAPPPECEVMTFHYPGGEKGKLVAYQSA
jgi:hypothetical protein